jgi:hypothetical protein
MRSNFFGLTLLACSFATVLRSACPGRLGPGKPTTGIAGCCARAASGHATAAPPTTVILFEQGLQQDIASASAQPESGGSAPAVISAFASGLLT